MTGPEPAPQLVRRLGTGDAVVIGLGSMIGAGVFAAFGPAARAAGAGLLVGLAIAAVIAYCNAIASAQLAAVYPVSGGTYSYGRERLGPWWGFVAGWAFLIGKTASCAAMAVTFASYVIDGSQWLQRVVAGAAVAAIASLNYHGVVRTAYATRILVVCTLLVLGIFVAVTATSGTFAIARLSQTQVTSAGDLYDILQSAGLLFFAFAGYARIATMGEEVKDPSSTIPKAIPRALLIAVVVYVVVGVVALGVAGAVGLADSTAPLSTVANSSGRGAIVPLLQVGASLASLGALLALMAGIGRTSLAMARQHDLPGWLGAIHPRHHVPHHAEVALACVVTVLVASIDLRHALGFSSFGVLLYYAIANLAAYTQPASDRRWPRGFNVLGALGCVVLAATLPLTAVITGSAVIALGVGGRLAVVLRRSRPLP